MINTDTFSTLFVGVQLDEYIEYIYTMCQESVCRSSILFSFPQLVMLSVKETLIYLLTYRLGSIK